MFNPETYSRYYICSNEDTLSLKRYCYILFYFPIFSYSCLQVLAKLWKYALQISNNLCQSRRNHVYLYKKCQLCKSSVTTTTMSFTYTYLMTSVPYIISH